jgi:hypothetical protein
MKKLGYVLLLAFLLLTVSCEKEKNKNNNLISKVQETDIFINTIVESQNFKINPNEDNIIQSQKGNLMIIPKGAFVDKNGKNVDDSVNIELAEATGLDEMILSNLNIQDSGNIYKSYSSFFLNASRKGEQLSINPDNPIYFETPADESVELYKGERDEKGNMSWTQNQEAVKYLIPVPLEILDFYPDGFEGQVEKGMPFKNYKVATKELIDSLYLSFADEFGSHRYSNGSINETDSKNDDLDFLANTDDESFYDDLSEDSINYENEADSGSFFLPDCGINPASIKAIKDKKFQNTLISTREFEMRLKTIFKTCNNQVLELYINNLDKNLWEIDREAAEILGKENSNYQTFLEYAELKQTKVEISDKRARLLSKQYEKNKKQIEKDLQKLKKEILKENQKFDEKANQKHEEYRELLEERQTYRMKKFGFEITEVGWYNVAHKITIEEVEKFELNITAVNGSQYDRVYAYVINPKIKSLFSYLSFDKKTFNIVCAEDPYLLLWKNQEFDVIVVGYKGKELGYQI